MGEHIQGHRNDVQVTGPLTITKEGSFDPICPGHQGQLGGSHTGAPVVVGMEGYDGVFPVFHVGAEPLNHVRVDVGCGHFHRGGKVQDNLATLGGFPGFHHGFADFQTIVQLCPCVRLRGILVDHLCAFQFIQLADDVLGPLDGDGLNLIFRLVEGDPSLLLRGGVVHVDDGFFYPLQALYGPVQKVLPGLD
jgi:hypothetical protein